MFIFVSVANCSMFFPDIFQTYPFLWMNFCVCVVRVRETSSTQAFLSDTILCFCVVKQTEIFSVFIYFVTHPIGTLHYNQTLKGTQKSVVFTCKTIKPAAHNYFFGSKCDRRYFEMSRFFGQFQSVDDRHPINVLICTPLYIVYIYIVLIESVSVNIFKKSTAQFFMVVNFWHVFSSGSTTHACPPNITNTPIFLCWFWILRFEQKTHTIPPSFSCVSTRTKAPCTFSCMLYFMLLKLRFSHTQKHTHKCIVFHSPHPRHLTLSTFACHFYLPRTMPYTHFFCENTSDVLDGSAIKIRLNSVGRFLPLG